MHISIGTVGIFPVGHKTKDNFFQPFGLFLMLKGNDTFPADIKMAWLPFLMSVQHHFVHVFTHRLGNLGRQMEGR